MAGFAVASQIPANPSSPSASDRHSKEFPSPLSLDTRAPSSPFPSPSSSFIPPPMPGAHEFANKPNMGRFIRRKKSGSPSNIHEDSASGNGDVHDIDLSKPVNGVVSSTDVRQGGTGAASTPPTPTHPPVAMTPTSSMSPSDSLSQHPESAEGHNTPTQVQITLPPLPPSPPQLFGATTPSLIRTSSGSGAASKHTSLSSTRPAPPSPASSRRQSLRSRHRSGVSNASSSSKFATIKAAVTPPAKRRGEIKIRDFAFHAVDARHTGRGPDTPKVIKRLLKQHGPIMATSSRRESGMSESSLDSEETSSRRSSGFGNWGAFRWASKLGGGWTFGPGSGSGSGIGNGSRANASYTPSQQDFERNFDDSIDVELSQSSADVDEGEYLSDDYDDDDDDDAGELENEELLPGLYKALYDFDPEGTAEMGLKEGQMIRVVGRGGGVGWAIAVRPDAQGEDESNWALVPESYLKLVRLGDTESDVTEGLSLDDATEERAG